jgi:hypothetical protein
MRSLRGGNHIWRKGAGSGMRLRRNAAAGQKAKGLPVWVDPAVWPGYAKKLTLDIFNRLDGQPAAYSINF